MDKPQDCARCSLANLGVGFVPDLVHPNALFEVRGERPWKHELAANAPFSGQAGFVLKQWGLAAVPQMRVALERQQVDLTNTLRCLPRSLSPKDTYPTKRADQLAAEECCSQYNKSAAPVVILAGEHAQRSTFRAELDAEDAVDRSLGHDLKGMMGRIGRQYTRDGRRYVFAPHPSAVLRSPYLVAHLQAALRIAANPMPAPVVANMTETPPVLNPTIGCDFEWGRDGKVSVIGFAFNNTTYATAHPRYQKWDESLEVLSCAGEIVGHNWHAADLRQLAKEGVAVDALEAKVFDTMLAMHATHAHLAGTGSYDIRSVVLLLGEQGGLRFPLDWKDYAGDIYETCRLDAAASLWVAAPLKRLIAAHHLQPTLDISHAVAPIFARMYEQGVRLDTSILERIHHERQTRTQETIAKFGLTESRGKKTIKSVPIWRSPKILEKFQSLFGVLPPDRSRKTWERLSMDRHLSSDARDFANAVLSLGKGANDAHWLGKVEDNEETGELTFGKVDSDGRIHPQYAVHGSPDRPIAKGPNINFPRPADDPRPTPLRAAVIPNNPEEVLIACDFSGVETYTTAIEADDWDAIQSIKRGEREHAVVAQACSQIAGFVLNRQQGKAVNHAFDKGESPANLAKRLFGVNVATRAQKAQCAAMYASLLTRYPKTAAFRDRLWQAAQSNPLVVANKFGRRLECFARSRYGEDRDWDTKHQPALKYWCPCKACAPRRERFKYALAFLGRSCALDVLLRVMARIWQEKRLDGYSLPLIEAHDELVYSVPRNSAEKYRKIVVDSFESPVLELGSIQLPASAHIGNNWAETK